MKRKITHSLIDVTGMRFDFETLSQLKEFCIGELEYWSNANNSIGENISVNQAYTKLNHTEAIIRTIDSWKETEPTWDENVFHQKFQHLKKQQLNQLSGDWVWHGHGFVPVWVDLYKKGQITADAFLDTVLKRSASSISASTDSLIGHILGYEYLMQGESEITKRQVSEKSSILQLRKELADKNNALISDIDQSKEDYDNWSAEEKTKMTRLYSVKQKLAERQIRNHKRKFSREFSAWGNKINNLEKTYEELLRLKKPAEYWHDAARKYERQGVAFSALILVLGIVSLVFLSDFFVEFLQGKKTELSLITLQGIIIFGTIVTVFGFLIRVFSRLAFSSFHLMRDAEEREQLTYLYLSLSEENNVDKDSRDIILQALFSRTETGLLNQEHGPTMPGLAEATKHALRSKPQ